MINLKDKEKIEEAEHLIRQIKRLRNLSKRDDLAEFRTFDDSYYDGNHNISSSRIFYEQLYLAEDFSRRSDDKSYGNYWVNKALSSGKASFNRILKSHIKIGIEELTKQLKATSVDGWEDALKKKAS